MKPYHTYTLEDLLRELYTYAPTDMIPAALAKALVIKFERRPRD